MKTENLLEMVRQHPFLEGLEPLHIEKLADLASEVRFQRDQIIFQEGDESTSFYLIVTGKVALEVSALGRILRVLTLQDGEEFGWSSILPAEGKRFQARALGVVRALAFDGVKLREACDQDSSLGYALTLRLLRIVADRLEAMRIQLLDMYSHPGAR
jgi:CRP-like cAMP-binding protein